MTPAAYSVRSPGHPKMLFTDENRAVDKAAVIGGVIVNLYSITQIIKLLEQQGGDHYAEVIELLEAAEES